MRILITGGAGFIGHNLALFLGEKGFDVVVFDSFERASRIAVGRLEAARIPVVRGDVRSFNGCQGFDVVVHAAAYVSVPESFEKPAEYIDNNVTGTARVAYVCGRAGARIIYLGSAAVYGEPVRLPIPEEHPVNPLSPYGLSKYLGELVLQRFSRFYGFKYVALRLFNVYGPGQNPSYAGVVTVFAERALRGEPLVVYGDGSQTRDFIYVGDVARIILGFIERDLFDNTVYNIGTGKPTTINQLARGIARLAGRDGVEIVYEKERPGDIRHSYADIRKLLSRINIEFTPLEEGLRHVLNSIRQ
ncbi:NAD-dependent epimerase/dehydratase family protein [Desulfurococcus amylolyticus]|uniref:NAD-dependent epimerase/dehydratase n=1 Tax=Desulfurococcus amylolyticus DSM 16532 TaxID=768672 RepID=I3XR65_DESAM|nr:NAD-dependent epimerase/dehydratase family protein [Desulfurococcus amylolyticus]AFL66439.1 NAD-dependent epimerase/dehydratase [Desulfurococcus amylolyticus DSM 16532]